MIVKEIIKVNGEYTVMRVYNTDEVIEVTGYLSGGYRVVRLQESIYFKNSAGEWMEPPSHMTCSHIQRVAADGKWR